jgi:hypothetical protein
VRLASGALVRALRIGLLQDGDQSFEPTRPGLRLPGRGIRVGRVALPDRGGEVVGERLDEVGSGITGAG